MSAERPGDPAPRPGTRLRPLTIRELNEGADALLRESFGPIWVAGEIASFTAHRSGHWYFALREGREASISCAMFRSKNARARVRPKEGDEVLLLGTPVVYAPQGRYQLVVDAIEPRGAGADALALERLKRKLADEGLFDDARKRPLPPHPERIGIATSRDGAALRDALRVLRRRSPEASVLLASCAVQGERAVEEIVDALWSLDARELDLILLVRGGGAREDLAAFDDERVVRAIAECTTPIVTGVGHEVDTTLADLVADVRASTPSVAAELAVRDRAELHERLRALQRRVRGALRQKLAAERARLLRARGSRGLGAVPLRVARMRGEAAEAERRLAEAQAQRLDALAQRLRTARERLAPDSHRRRLERRRARLSSLLHALETRASRRVTTARRRLEGAARKLDALSPLRVLGRGYALVTRDGRVVRDATTLAAEDMLRIRLERGAVRARVEETFADDAASPADGRNDDQA
jgi:exodeoxyribonuclease VII large subunit